MILRAYKIIKKIPHMILPISNSKECIIKYIIS